MKSQSSAKKRTKSKPESYEFKSVYGSAEKKFNKPPRQVCVINSSK